MERWFLSGTEGNASPDSDGCVEGIVCRWLIAQVTTEGDISGSINVQIFPLGIQSETNVVRISFDFDGIGEYFNEEILGCMDDAACNYNPDVNTGRRFLRRGGRVWGVRRHWHP